MAGPCRGINERDATVIDHHRAGTRDKRAHVNTTSSEGLPLRPPSIGIDSDFGRNSRLLHLRDPADIRAAAAAADEEEVLSRRQLRAGYRRRGKTGIHYF